MSSLEIIKPTLSQAEDMLDDVVERESQILSLPEGSNPFFQPSWASKKIHTVLSSLFHASCAAAPELKNLTKKLHMVQSLIEKADKQFTRFPPDLASTGRHPPPPKVIGRDAECRNIVGALCSSQPDDGWPYTVMGIHGAAGSGKTTLARCVYARAQEEDENGSGFFDLCIWVQVGHHLTLHEAFFAMMEAAMGRPPSPPPPLDRDDGDIVSLLRRSLQDELRGKRLLLVLDDIRYNGNADDPTDLKEILSPLDVAAAGSKVLLTARSVDALLALGAVGSCCLPIRDLDDDVFLRLFMHYALGDDGVDERDRGILQVIGADIAAKLKRSPLAAKLVGTELRATPTIDVWRSVRDTISIAA
jgi:hypothetical protein